MGNPTDIERVSFGRQRLSRPMSVINSPKMQGMLPRLMHSDGQMQQIPMTLYSNARDGFSFRSTRFRSLVGHSKWNMYTRCNLSRTLNMAKLVIEEDVGTKLL